MTGAQDIINIERIEMNNDFGLYIVATPIGNLGDISERAITTIREGDLIICENPKHSLKLLNKLGIKKKLISLHDYNEKIVINKIAADLINKNGINSGPYIGESYDAAALIVLAMQSGNSTSSESIVKNILDVANSPGTKIYPGELKKGLDLIIKGKKINYEGVTNVEFSKDGKIKGSFLEQVIKNGKFKSQQQR